MQGYAIRPETLDYKVRNEYRRRFFNDRISYSALRGDEFIYSGPIGLYSIDPGNEDYLTNSPRDRKLQDIAYESRNLMWEFLGSDLGGRFVDYVSKHDKIVNQVKGVGSLRSLDKRYILGAAASPASGAILFSDRYWELADLYADALKIPRSDVAYALICHELVHLFLDEADEANVEQYLIDFFTELSHKETRSSKKEIYKDLARLSASRLENVAKNYRSGKITKEEAIAAIQEAVGEEVDEGTIENVLESCKEGNKSGEHDE